MSTVRTRSREATRERILDAVYELLTEESPAALSMPTVAERAEVGLRTVYRYFPTKEALLDAASMSLTLEAVRAVGGPPTWATLSEYLRVSWRSFTRQLAAVKAQHLTPAGREMRARRLPQSRAAIRSALTAEGTDLGDEDLDRLVDLLVVLSSSSTYLELVDRLGRDADDASRLAVWAIEAVHERAVRDGGVAR